MADRSYLKLPPKQRFTRLVVLRNPNSTRARDEMGLVETLEEYFKESAVTTLYTHSKKGKPHHWLDEAARDGLLGPRTLLAVIAGDGTLHHVINTLLTNEELQPTARHTVVLPLWGGNANDLARMLNGMPSRNQVAKIMRSGKVVAIHPIEFTLSKGQGQPRKRLALCYASFGASAAVARAINESSFRKLTLKSWPPLRLVREFTLVVKTLNNAPRFLIADGEQGKQRRLFERVFINGSRLAKVERVALNLTDKHFYETSVSRMRLGALFSRALELSDRRFSHKVAETEATFTALSDVLGQFDGEDFDVPAGTTVKASVHDTPFYALSLRLK
jgi:diacylglycerol kinase family enzyme